MYRNKDGEIHTLSSFLISLKTSEEMSDFLREIFTKPELETLSKRWRILNMLFEGKTQREIAKTLGVSLCKVTRGSKILKDKNSIITKHLIKEKKYGNIN